MRSLTFAVLFCGVVVGAALGHVEAESSREVAMGLFCVAFVCGLLGI